MGLNIYSLDNIPENLPDNIQRDYFIYLLDYGWDEPISNIIKKNYDKISDIAAKNKAVAIKGTVAEHFQNEVLSWHHINGEDAKDLLPALLITNKNPHYFRNFGKDFSYNRNKKIEAYENNDMKMILIPFKKSCNNENDVINMLQSIFNDIMKGEELLNFEVLKEQKKGVGNAIADSIILQPNVCGIGFDLKGIISYLKKKILTLVIENYQDFLTKIRLFKCLFLPVL